MSVIALYVDAVMLVWACMLLHMDADNKLHPSLSSLNTAVFAIYAALMSLREIFIR